MSRRATAGERHVARLNGAVCLFGLPAGQATHLVVRSAHAARRAHQPHAALALLELRAAHRAVPAAVDHDHVPPAGRRAQLHQAPLPQAPGSGLAAGRCAPSRAQGCKAPGLAALDCLRKQHGRARAAGRRRHAPGRSW